MHWYWQHSYPCHGQNRLSDRNLLQTVNRNSQLTNCNMYHAQQQPERKNCLPTCTTINAHIMSDMSCLPSRLQVLPAPMHLPLRVDHDTTLHYNSSFAQVNGKHAERLVLANTIHLSPRAQPRDTTVYSPRVVRSTNAVNCMR
jgi:hypothetical protein